MSDKYSVSPLKYFASGFFGGACTVLVDYPIDKLKAQACKDVKFVNLSDFWGCAVSEFKKQGYKGIYKGVAEPITAIPPVFALSFFGFGLGKRIFQSSSSQELSLFKLFCAGAFSGFLTTAVMTQESQIKAILQKTIKKDGLSSKGVVENLKNIISEENMKTSFKGTLPMFLKDIPANGFYFMAYEGIRRILVPAEKRNNICLLRTIVAGGTAGTTFCLVSIPADIIRTRTKLFPTLSIVDVAQKVVKEEGIIALYKGSGPAFARAFPANAACFAGFETCKKFLNWVLPNPL